MLRHSISNFNKRFYSDSKFSQRAPVVKFANARTARALKKRPTEESPYRDVKERDPTKTFEPFPIKVTEGNKLEILRRRIMPLHDLPYEEQLAKKQSLCKNSLRRIAQELYKNGTPVRLDVARLPCHVNPIVEATELHRYRNLDEFSIWQGLDGTTPTVGFNLFPISKHGSTVSVEPHISVTVMREEVVRLTDILQDFIRNKAKLPICTSLGEGGGWRRFQVRSNRVGELMLVGFLSPRVLKVQQIIDEKENFRDFIVEQSKAVNLTLKSLYFQPCPNNRCSHQQVPFELLYGEKTLSEIINGLTFLISPESFGHQSTSGAELVVRTIRKTAIECFGLDPQSNTKPLLLEIPCGIGCTGLNMADLVSRIVGIDRSAQSIQDCRLNAPLNNISHAEYINNEPEIVIERVLEKYSAFKSETLVVCVTPNRGLHRNVVEALRRCRDVKKIIYVTPLPDGEHFMNNILDFCQKDGGRALPPFIPVSATPIDVCPQIEQSNFVLALERLPE